MYTVYTNNTVMVKHKTRAAAKKAARFLRNVRSYDDCTIVVVHDNGTIVFISHPSIKEK